MHPAQGDFSGAAHATAGHQFVTAQDFAAGKAYPLQIRERTPNLIRAEFVGDRVTMEVREVVDHYGDIIVRARYDGTFDKTDLPDELVLSNYFSIRDGKIVSLAVIFNQPSPY